MVEIRTYLKNQAIRIDRFLEAELGRAGIPEELREAMCYSVFAGGKRIRPVLAMAAYETAGGRGDAVLPVAAALELVHTYSLIHDDLPAMDDDDLRRGKPTNHKVFGEARAILAGDALLTEAFEMVSDGARCSLGEGTRIRIIHEIAVGAGARGMVAGQTADILAEGREIDGEILQGIHRRKTGALIRAAVRAGAIAGGVDDRGLQSLTRYADNVGLAFQVTDDILDVTGSEAELGKSTSDVARGKATYPALYGLDRARTMAGVLVETAVSALEPFGVGGGPLRAIAELVLSRTH